MPRFYIVNIEGCKGLDPCFDGIKEFTVMDGQYYCRYDVVEDSIPVDFCNKIRYETDNAKKHIDELAMYYGRNNSIFDECDFMPIGFNNLPLGTTIKEI